MKSLATLYCGQQDDGRYGTCLASSIQPLAPADETMSACCSASPSPPSSPPVLLLQVHIQFPMTASMAALRAVAAHSARGYWPWSCAGCGAARCCRPLQLAAMVRHAGYVISEDKLQRTRQGKANHGKAHQQLASLRRCGSTLGSPPVGLRAHGTTWILPGHAARASRCGQAANGLVVRRIGRLKGR